MWAADIPHVNYLQFPSVDRLRFQEKLSGKGHLEGPLPSRKGCLEVCLSGPFQGADSCFLGGDPHFPFLLQDGRRGRVRPQPYPGHPLTFPRGSASASGSPAHGAARAWLWAGAGVGARPPAGPGPEAVWAPARGAGLIATAPPCEFSHRSILLLLPRTMPFGGACCSGVVDMETEPQTAL